MNERSEHLEKLSTKFNEFETNLKQVKTWTVEHAPSSIQIISSSNLSPEERSKTSQQLNEQLTTYQTTIDQLNQQMESLIGRFEYQLRANKSDR